MGIARLEAGGGPELLNFARIRSHLLLGALLGLLLGGPWHPPAAFLATYANTGAVGLGERPGHHQKHQAPTAVAPAEPTPGVTFESPRADLAEAPDVASLAIPGRNGNYLIPYIQTQPSLHFRVGVQNLPENAMVLVHLDPGTPGARLVTASAPTYDGDFTDLPMGDHRVLAEVYSPLEPVNRWGLLTRRSLLASAQLTHVARGDIVAAIGDSTTEGNGGARFHFIPNWMNAQANAAAWTSPDGRNFPQAGAFARPEAPASFTSTLGTLLEQQRHHPVLVLNDGWSGATTQSYKDISSSQDLAAEYAAAQPNVWIVNLGVNDPIIHASAADFGANLRTVLQTLTSRYGARSADIHVACPTYAKDKRHDGEATYLPLIDRLRADAGLGAAPDFFSFYRGKPSDLADEVHPNAGGYRDMASLWARALRGQGSSCS